MSVFLYAASVTPLADPDLYAAAYRAASEGRRQKTDRCRRAADRHLSLGAELLLQYALKAAGEPSAPEYAADENGKPYLPGGGRHFNLSHSGTYALCALSGREVGCDIEAVAETDALEIAGRFFCPEEAADIAAAASREDRLVRFYRYWTLKESYLKATGPGMTLPLDRFRVELAAGPSVIRDGRRAPYTFLESADIPGYRIALCAEEDCRDTRLTLVDIRPLIGAKSRSDND